ncbi:MAG: bifunctional 2-polyprenyl-6-hydroxyphenol methylase/3-demethylubiquinol 3-O-methyltransferase UbiG [Enterovibrio sp.]
MAQSQNVDPSEIAKFEALAQRWWDTSGEFKPLHQLNPLRLNYILQRTDGIFGKKILDVGCGGGILSESLALQGAQVTGLDMGAAPLQVAKAHAQAQQLPINYVQTTAEAHAADPHAFYDVITCMEVLEHVPDPRSLLAACRDMLTPNGSLFLSTLNRTPLSWLFAIVGAEYILKKLPKGTHTHSKFIRPSELLKITTELGFSDCHIAGISYNPLRDNFYLSSNVQVNYMVHLKMINV